MQIARVSRAMSLSFDLMLPSGPGNTYSELDAATAFFRNGTSCAGIGSVSTCPPFVVGRRYDRWMVAIMVRRSMSLFLSAKSSPLRRPRYSAAAKTSRHRSGTFARNTGTSCGLSVT